MTVIIKYLKTDKCPICGETTIVAEEIEVSRDGTVREHTNGGRWEKRTFLCGQGMRYIPNYGRDEYSEYNICKNDPVRNEYIRKKRALYSKIHDFIAEESDLIKKDTEKLDSNIKQLLN